MEGKAIVRILVVDDDEAQCQLLQQILGECGYVCESTTSPMNALSKLSEIPYNLIISDITMEEKDGLELLKEARSLHPETKFIMMTGYVERYLYSQIIDAGATDFIPKPFPAEELLAKIERLQRETKADEELRRHRDHLEDLVERRTADLSRANELLQQEIAERERMANSLRESESCIRQLNEHILNMLMVISHDIRGPLVAIAAIAKLLLRGVYGKLDQSVENTVRDLLSRIVQLIGIAEDCLGKAHAVDGSIRLERESLDLRQGIVDPVLDEISSDIEKHHIAIDNRLGSIPAGKILIKANRTWLKVVFRNLFRNAIKYGGSGCTIAFGFQDLGCCYRLNVYNTGKPIPEEQRDKLFTKFGRIQGAVGGQLEGIGMGLYLIKKIVSEHGGDIWYEARPDGSDFVFTIPKE
jgi:signal transduction histidine kinase